MVLSIKKIAKKVVVYSLSLILILLCIMFLVQFYFGGVSFSDILIELPGGYQYVEESNDIRVIGGPENIEPNVISYSYNSDFILVARHPIPEIDTLPEDEVKVIDSLELYIISIKDNKKYGPLTLNEYLLLRTKLGIENELLLNLKI